MCRANAMLAGIRSVVLSTGLLVLACCPDVYYEAWEASPSVRLPRGEAPHCYGGEWWYYTGRLKTTGGRGYGIEAVIFHLPGPGTQADGGGWAAHFAVLDETTGEFTYDQIRKVCNCATTNPGAGGFHLDASLVRMNGANGHDELHAAMADGSYALDLVLDDERGPVLHGGDGYVPYGQKGMSFYYSRPQMAASGTLEVDGEPREVSGTLWFDRQWGASLVNPWEEWDWFSLRLDDGSKVMVFVFRDDVSPVRFGTYIPPEGEPVWLAAEDVVITETASWTSPHTDATYPVAWDMAIVPQGLALGVAAVADDQELRVRRSTFNVYWEGLCSVTGNRDGEALTGHAYVELTNYHR